MDHEYRWTIDDLGGEGVYETDCGRTFVFNDGGPYDNGFQYCGYCGGKLIEVYASRAEEGECES